MSGQLSGWVGRLDAQQSADVLALLDRVTAADGTAPISEQAVHAVAGSSPARHQMWIDEQGIGGYAQLAPGHGEHPAMVEVAVDPDRRSNGIGGGLVSAALAEGGPGTRVWAHGDGAPARAVAQRLGLSGVRELLQLRRTLDAPPLPDLVVPKDISIRKYRGPIDDPEILRVNAAAFAWHPEQGSWTDREIAERREESWFDSAGLFLAYADEAPERLLGFHWTKVHADHADGPAIGEVYVVAIAPDAQGRGLGRALTVAGLHYLRDRSLGSVLLYVEGDNVAALRTYEQLGFERFHTDVAYASIEQ